MSESEARELTRRALDAASQIAARLGLSCHEATVIADRSNLVVHFRPTDVVARVATDTAAFRRGDAWLAREIAMARHLKARGAPVVPPSSLLPPGPHHRDGFFLSFWQRVEVLETPAAPDAAGFALRECHEALEDFEGSLVSMGTFREARELLETLEASPPGQAQGEGIPNEEDLLFLRTVAERTERAIAALGRRFRPLHGDSHLGNVLHTPNGPLWSDWEDAFLGPREWDLACLVTPSAAFGEGGPEMEAALQACAPRIDEEILGLLVEARAVQVLAWGALFARDRAEFRRRFRTRLQRFRQTVTKA